MRLLILTIASLMFAAVARADDSHIPPLDDLQRTGCQIDLIGGEDVVPGWHVRVWATYTSREQWRQLYAVETESTKAFKACADWLALVKKAIKDAKDKAEKTDK